MRTTDKTMTLAGWINFYETRLTVLDNLPQTVEGRRKSLQAVIDSQQRQLDELNSDMENRDSLIDEYREKLNQCLDKKRENEEAGIKGMTPAQLKAKSALREKVIMKLYEQMGDDMPEKYREEAKELLMRKAASESS